MSQSHIGLHFSDNKHYSKGYPSNVKAKIIFSINEAKLKQQSLLQQIQIYQSIKMDLKYPQEQLPTNPQELLSYINSSFILQFSVRKANIDQFCNYLDRIFYESGGKISPNSAICTDLSSFVIEQTIKVNYLFNIDPSSSDDNFFVIVKSGQFEQQMLDTYFDQFSALSDTQETQFEFNIHSELNFKNILDIIRQAQGEEKEIVQTQQQQQYGEEEKIGAPPPPAMISANSKKESLFTAFSRNFSMDCNFLSTSSSFLQICYNLLLQFNIIQVSYLDLLNKIEKVDLDFSFNSSDQLPQELKNQIFALGKEMEKKITIKKGEEKVYLEMMELVENPWKITFTHQLLGTIEMEVSMQDFLLFFKYFAF